MEGKQNEVLETDPVENVPLENDFAEELENIKVMQESINQLVEQSGEVTGIDQFFVDNADLILTVLKLICFYGFVGVPLLVIVLLFWTVYKQFLYTNI